jgi:hypothetical protein
MMNSTPKVITTVYLYEHFRAISHQLLVKTSREGLQAPSSAFPVVQLFTIQTAFGP